MVIKNRYFTVGPAAIYPNVPQWTQEFYELGYASISHRSYKFSLIYQHLDEQLRQLMCIPQTHSIFVASSGSEIMERILQNCVSNLSFHFVNGAFSQKFYDYATRLHINPIKYEVSQGNDFDFIPDISSDVDLIALTHNETSTGIRLSEEFIYQIKNTYPSKIITLDTVSSAPLINLDFSLIDISFFSSQKAFGLPAGLGIWIMKKTLAEDLVQKNISRGAHNTLKDYVTHYTNFQTPSTPNVLGVYLMGLVAENMNKIGRKNIYSDTLKKKEFLRNLFSNNRWLTLKALSGLPSDTVIPVEFIKDREEVMKLLENNGIIVSLGYKENKMKELRFANYPAISWEDLTYLEKILM